VIKWRAIRRRLKNVSVGLCHAETESLRSTLVYLEWMSGTKVAQDLDNQQYYITQDLRRDILKGSKRKTYE
jgi:hypothetical protein